ncbi:TetR family transcriptional regulator [Sphingobacteriaceae bacterium]|nr:TetR family transcriptional regulator [Sphingobacteriaceae bacterium]
MPTAVKKKISKRENILKEAALLFKEKGYGSASMRDLAERVGVEAASIYSHIKSKDEMLEEICFRIAGEYVSHISKVENEKSSYTEKLKSIIRLHIQLMIEDAASVSVTNNDWKSLPEPKLSIFKTLRKGYEARFAALIENGISKKEFAPINVSVAMFTILSAIRWIELWYNPKRKISEKELEKDITNLLLSGLKK